MTGKHFNLYLDIVFSLSVTSFLLIQLNKFIECGIFVMVIGVIFFLSFYKFVRYDSKD